MKEFWSFWRRWTKTARKFRTKAESPLVKNIFKPTTDISNESYITSVGLENAGEKSLAAGIATFGQVFAPGEVMEGQAIQAWIAGRASTVQVDVKTTYEDGSARMAVLSVERPALAPGALLDAVLQIAPDTVVEPPDLSLLAGLRGHAFRIVIVPMGEAGQKIDVFAALRAGLADGTASAWLEGPLAAQARVNIELAGSMRMVFDITAYAGGGYTVEAQFNNDAAMQADGGRVGYRVAVRMDGALVANERLDQGQYQNWHRSFSLDEQDGGQGTGGLNIRHDIADLADTGAIAHYDTGLDVAEGLLQAWGAAAQAPGATAPLAPHGVQQFMPGTGGRDDIGFTTAANTAWLLTGDARVAGYAMGQAEAAGAVPWHLWDATTGNWLSAADHPALWTDPRGGANSLTQQPDALCGWTPDSAHQPSLSYVPYLLTGERWMLDNLQSQAAWNVLNQWPDARGPDGLLVVQGNQVRGAAWSLRQIDEAAWASPDGSVAKAQFTEVSNANWSWIVSQIPAWTVQQGEAHGWLPGEYGSAGAMPPWQQDYFASTAIAAARHGNADAATFLEWASNFLVGRFTSADKGFAEHDGAAYLIAIADPTTGQPYTSWARIGAETAARGWSNGDGWSHSQGDYAQLALATLAGIAEVTGSAAAAAAYHALRADGAPFTAPADFARDPTYAIAAPSPTVITPETIPEFGAGQHVVRLSLSGDSWQGDARCAVLLDGATLGETVVTADHEAGERMSLNIRLDDPDGRVVTVRFLNDAWGGTADSDRNLYVDAVHLDAVDLHQSAALLWASDAVFML